MLTSAPYKMKQQKTLIQIQGVYFQGLLKLSSNWRATVSAALSNAASTALVKR